MTVDQEKFCDCCGISLYEHLDKMGTKECSCDDCGGCSGQLVVDIKSKKEK